MIVKLIHINCGGIIEPVYQNEESEIPAILCLKCGREILGDSEIEIVDDKGEVVER